MVTPRQRAALFVIPKREATTRPPAQALPMNTCHTAGVQTGQKSL
jgi:hypothetical protein